MEYTQLITVEPGKRGGQPCIRGMRITVRDVLEYLAGGMTVSELLADFPELTSDDIRACFSFAAGHILGAVAAHKGRGPAVDAGPSEDMVGVRLNVGSPRLADRGRAVDFAMEVTELPRDLGPIPSP